MNITQALSANASTFSDGLFIGITGTFFIEVCIFLFCLWMKERAEKKEQELNARIDARILLNKKKVE